MKPLYAVSVAVLSGLVVAALLVITFLDLDRGNKVATVVAGIVAVITLALSTMQVLRDSKKRGRMIAATNGSVAAGGNVRGNAFGDKSVVTMTADSSVPSSPVAEVDVLSEGGSSIAAAGSVEDNAFGRDSRRLES